MAKQIYKCEKCGQEFQEEYDCVRHETECFNKQDIVDLNFLRALDFIKKTYNLNIKNASAKLWVHDCDGFIDRMVQINIVGILPNGHKVEYSDPWWTYDKEDDISEKCFYSFIETELIIPYLDTKYEGEISKEYSDFGDAYLLGNIKIKEICRRLYGKKVRIEVIE